MKKLWILLIPAMAGMFSFPVAVLLGSLWEPTYLITLGFFAIAYIGIGFYYFRKFMNRAEVTHAMYVLGGLLLGFILCFVGASFVFGLACMTGGGCL